MSCQWNAAGMCNKPDVAYCRHRSLTGRCLSYEENIGNAQEAKADAGKLQIHMVPMQIVRDCAEVRMYGTAKYGDENNWRKVELIRYIDAMLRHTLAFVDDIRSVDEESGIPHYKHAECNWSFISELMKEMERDADGRVCSETPAAAGE